jgi:hypothetical protein
MLCKKANIMVDYGHGVIYVRKGCRITGIGIILNNHLSRRRGWARKGEAPFQHAPGGFEWCSCKERLQTSWM